MGDDEKKDRVFIFYAWTMKKPHIIYFLLVLNLERFGVKWEDIWGFLDYGIEIPFRTTLLFDLLTNIGSHCSHFLIWAFGLYGFPKTPLYLKRLMFQLSKQWQRCWASSISIWPFQARRFTGFMLLPGSIKVILGVIFMALATWGYVVVDSSYS